MTQNMNEIDAAYDLLEVEWDKTSDQAKIDEIVTKLENLVNEGYGEACVLLWRIFTNAKNKKRDEIRALDYVEKAVSMKVLRAFYYLSTVYDTNHQAEKAFNIVQQGAELGDLPCMVRLSGKLVEGDGTSKDELSGLRWLKKAVDAGSREAQLSYAVLLLSGELKVLAADIPKAIEILESLYKDEAEAIVAWNLSVAYFKMGEERKDAALQKKSDEWRRIAADMGYEAAKNVLVNDKRREEWKSLENFANGKESYYFFYKTGKVVDKRTETRSHTSSSGYGANQRVSTSHTSWQVIELRDPDGNKFEVTPDTTLVISTGEEVYVVYICKGGETIGQPFLMVNRNTGAKYEVKGVNKARASAGGKVGGSNAAGCVAWLMVIFGLIWTFAPDGFFLTVIGVGLLGFGATILFKMIMAEKANSKLVKAHFEKIATFLQQK